MSAHPLFSPPEMHHAGHGEERRVSWLELFYDLVYVATLIQVGNALAEHLTLDGVLQFVLVFAALWWAWSGFTFYINRFIADDLVHRVLIYLQIIAVAFLGISADGALGELTTQFAIFYIIVRLVLMALYLRSIDQAPKARPLIQRYIIGYLVGVAAWAVSAFLPQYAIQLWSFALLFEVFFFLSPGTYSLQKLLPPDSPHMRERYGIFVIIVMGETFIKTITAASGMAVNLEILAFGVLSIFVVFALWWLYFGELEELSLRAEGILPQIWVYAHLPLSLALTAFGVASKKVFLVLGEDHIKEPYLFLFCGSLIVYLLSVALVDQTLKSHLARFNRLPAYGLLVILLLGLALVASHYSALLLMTVVAVAFAALIIFEVRHAAVHHKPNDH